MSPGAAFVPSAVVNPTFAPLLDMVAVHVTRELSHEKVVEGVPGLVAHRVQYAGESGQKFVAPLPTATSDLSFGQYLQIHGVQAVVGAGPKQKSVAAECPPRDVLVDQWKSVASAHGCGGVARMHRNVAPKGAPPF